MCILQIGLIRALTLQTVQWPTTLRPMPKETHHLRLLTPSTPRHPRVGGASLPSGPSITTPLSSSAEDGFRYRKVRNWCRGATIFL
jgi:hypothetical protein